LIGDLKGCYGFGCIAFPFTSNRLDHRNSLLWILGNITFLSVFLFRWIY
jgi:hypothetical protein